MKSRENAGWRIALLAVASMVVSACNQGDSSPPPPQPPTNPARTVSGEPVWQYGVMGSNIGATGIFAADLNGDNKKEIIASASSSGFGANAMWYVLSKNDAGYDQVFRGPEVDGAIVRLQVGRLNDDAVPDILVASQYGTVRVYDGHDFHEIRHYSIGDNPVAVLMADVEGSSALELVVSDGTDLRVYAAASGALLWGKAEGGGTSLAVGNVDADPGKEIVATTSSQGGFVSDVQTRAVQWNYIDGFGYKVRVADLDNDGLDEIVGAGTWQRISVFSAALRTPLWEIITAQDISAMELVNVTGNSTPEIVYGDGQWGGLHVIDAATRQEVWTMPNPDHGVQAMLWADVDNDGANEVVWSAGGSSSGADHLYVVDPVSKEVEWVSTHLDGPLSAEDIGDVDGDGNDELVMVSFESNSGYAEGVISIFDAQTHALEWQGPLGVMDWMGVRSVKVADVDSDGRADIVVATGRIYEGRIRVYDGITHQQKAESPGYDGNFFSALAIGDVDGDGKNEIVAGQGREHTGALGAYVVVFDGETLQEKWKTVNLTNGWQGVYSIKLADLDGNGRSEILLTLPDAERVMAFDGASHHQLWLIASHAFALDYSDIDNDDVPEILVGRGDGKIDVYGSDFVYRNTVQTGLGGPVHALVVADLNGDERKDWLLASENGLSLFDGQKPATALWEQTGISTCTGYGGAMLLRQSEEPFAHNLFVGSCNATYDFKLITSPLPI